MGSVPSRLVGIVWFGSNQASAEPTQRFTAADFHKQATSRFSLGPSQSTVSADLDRLESELTAVFETAKQEFYPGR